MARVVDEPSEDVVAIAKRERDTRGPISRIVLFLRQVWGELRKVVTPTRKELISYTAIVLGFLIVMMALVTGLDYGFGALVSLVFGNGSLTGISGISG